MNLITIAVISTCVGLVYGISPCQTPSGRSGECILLTQCEPLKALVNKPKITKQDVILLQKSKCGWSPDSVSFAPKVCCPKQSEPEPVYNSISGTCRTPDGKPGKCVNIYSCPLITNLLRPPVSNENFNFVERSKCKSSEEYSVCCASPPENQTPSRYTVTAGGCQLSAFPPDPRSECCGEMVAVGNKIVGTNGSATMIDEHPWTVLIEYIRRIDSSIGLSCGGSLISGKYVLTAAHCVTGRILELARPKRVRLGEFDTSNEGADCVAAAGGGEDCTDGAIRIDIERTIPHPKYDQFTKKNDIGLIRLKELAPFTDFIRPICLPVKDLTRPENTPPVFSMYAVGWGKTEFRESSDVKVQINLPFVSLEKCQPAYQKPGRAVDLWRGQLCAGGVDGKDSCKGDSGGPLVYETQTRFQLIGVVSFGQKECGTNGVPGIYTNVYEYRDWINGVIVG